MFCPKCGTPFTPSTDQFQSCLSCGFDLTPLRSYTNQNTNIQKQPEDPVIPQDKLESSEGGVGPQIAPPVLPLQGETPNPDLLETVSPVVSNPNAPSVSTETAGENQNAQDVIDKVKSSMEGNSNKQSDGDALSPEQLMEMLRKAGGTNVPEVTPHPEPVVNAQPQKENPIPLKEESHELEKPNHPNVGIDLAPPLTVGAPVPRQSSSARVEVDPTTTGSEAKTILIIEDDSMIADIYKTQLEIAGYTITLAGTGTKGKELLASEAYNLLLLDIMLPGENGLNILKIMKEDHKLPDIPVIILSNLDQGSIIDRGLSLGAVDFLVKANNTPDDILQAVRKTIG